MKTTVILLFSIGLGILVTGTAAQERSYTLIERDLEYLVNLWPGDYQNREQVQVEATFSRPEPSAGGIERVHAQIRQVNLESFGDYVLYVEEFRNNDPSDVTRQRLYVLTADEAENAIRIRQHLLPEEARFSGAQKNLDGLGDLEPGDTVTLEGCDLLIRRDGDWLAGSVQLDTCPSDRPGRSSEASYEIRVSADQYWFRDPDFGTPAWHQLERARWFTCMIDFPREEGGAPVVTHHYIKLHDQGGTFAFTHPDGRDMVLTMRNTWSYGMQRESFAIVVQEGDESGRTLVYAWGNPGADRIGMNPGYLRVQCDLDTPEHVRMQHALRPDS